MNVIKCSCLICKSIITTSNLTKHYKSKSCLSGSKLLKLPKLNNCPHCNLELNTLPGKTGSANHIRWCTQNPLHKSYISSASERITNLCTGKKLSATHINKIKQAHVNGNYSNAASKTAIIRKLNPFKHTLETRKKISISALASNHQRVCKALTFTLIKSEEHLSLIPRGKIFLLLD